MSVTEITTTRALVRHYGDVRKRLENAPLKVTKIEESAPLIEEPPAEIIDLPSFLPPRYFIDVAGGTHPTATGVAAVVCAFYNITKSEFVAARREIRTTRPRQIAMYLARAHTTSSLPQIGRLYGGRDHSTVLAAIDRIKELISTDPQIAADVKEIESQILGGARVVEGAA